VTIQVQNYIYVPQSAASISFYLSYDRLAMTQIYTQVVADHIPAPIPNIEMTRFNTSPNKPTEINTLLNVPMQPSNDFYM
jgi:hypothetical protein